MEDKTTQGFTLLNEIHGEHTGGTLINLLKDVCPDYVDMVAEFAYGTIFQRHGLDRKTRLLITVSLCTALGDMEPQLKANMEAALACGATIEECIESIVQVVLYAGFARVTNGLLVAKQIIEIKEGIAS